MATLVCKDDVRFRAFTPGLVRILSALDSIALSGPALVPGLPDELVITSANDSTHGPSSRHYKDEALDVRSRTFPNQASKDLFRMTLQSRLGPKFTVLLEGEHTANEHFHVQVKKGGTFP